MPIHRCGAGAIRGRHNSARLVLSIVLAATLLGCGSGGSPHPVDPDIAGQTLLTVLNGWKTGAELENWRAEHTDIVVQDLDWHFGRQLRDFEVLSDGRAVDANLHCDVRLTLCDEQGEVSEKTVTYLVSTSPRRTVFRQIIP